MTDELIESLELIAKSALLLYQDHRKRCRECTIMALCTIGQRLFDKWQEVKAVLKKETQYQIP